MTKDWTQSNLSDTGNVLSYSLRRYILSQWGRHGSRSGQLAGHPASAHRRQERVDVYVQDFFISHAVQDHSL